MGVWINFSFQSPLKKDGIKSWVLKKKHISVQSGFAKVFTTDKDERKKHIYVQAEFFHHSIN